MIASILADHESRILALEEAMATHNHIAEDDEESSDLCEEMCMAVENEQLLKANTILHAKVASLREQITAMEAQYDEVDAEDVNMDLVKQVGELREQNQRLADICEERDEQIAVLTEKLQANEQHLFVWNYNA